MKSQGLRRVFRWLVVLTVVAAVTMALIAYLGSDSGKRLPKPEACPVVSNVIETIVHVFAPDGDYLRLDVRKLSCREFQERLDEVSGAAALWTPGEGDWLIIGAEHGCSNTLEQITNRFTEEETVFSLPEIFANYVGTIDEIRPAFASVTPEDGVVPELFVARELPDFGWLTDGEVDGVLAAKTREQIRALQTARRIVLRGDILSRRQQETLSVAKWASAYRLAPNDTLLLERMDHLRRNAEVFYKIGKYGMACKCYETLLGIKPDDYVAAMNLAECLKCLGKRELAAAVLKKAETLRAR